MSWTRSSSSNKPSDLLAGKRIGIIGSSSADIDRTPGAQYWEAVALRTGAIILDYADGGSTLTASTENYAAEGANQLKRIDDLPTTGIDVVVIQPCANDDNGGRPLGTWTSTSVTEVYGALHAMCKKMYDKYPTLPFGVITPQYYGNHTAQTNVYHTAIKEVCGYYSVPVCDLHSEGRTPYSYPSWQSVYAPDGLHLIDAGDAVLARRVEAFVRMLFGY